MTFRPRRIVSSIIIAALMLIAVIPCAAADSYILGDADGDGEVTIMDATCIQRCLAELSVTGNFSRYAADLNRSGDIDITEATGIQRWLAGFEISYPVGTRFVLPTEAPTQRPTDEEGWGRDIYRP